MLIVRFSLGFGPSVNKICLEEPSIFVLTRLYRQCWNWICILQAKGSFSIFQKNGEDLEVRNPMFFEDVPTWNGSTTADDEESPKFGTTDGTMTSQEETDVEATVEQNWTSVTLSAPFPRPPPSTPTSSTPTPSPSEESGPDAKTMDVNKNLTQVSREAEVKTRSTSDDP